MSTSIYVGNLPYSVSEEDLRTNFEDFGEVVSAKVITDRETGRSKGFGFVEMATPEAAEKAISALDGGELMNRQIRVNLAKPREPRNNRW